MPAYHEPRMHEIQFANLTREKFDTYAMLSVKGVCCLPISYAGEFMKYIPAIMLLVLVVAACNLTSKLKRSGSSESWSSSSSKESATGGAEVEKANPTAAQMAAIANGQTVKWDQQGITWTMPGSWSKSGDIRNETFGYGGGGAFLSGNISTMDPSFPSDISIKAMYESAKSQQKLGKYDEVKWLEIDGLRGVEFRESKPEMADDIRRLEWQAYRKYAGQNQLVTLILSTNGASFPKHEDELYGILYSMKIVH